MGGARGGGKTDSVIGKLLIKSQIYLNHFNAIVFRRELPMLDDLIARSQEVYGRLGGDWNEQKKQWKMPGGGRIRFRPLERTSDAEKYQGQNVTDCVVEEAGNYPDPAPIDRLHGILRSAHGVPTQLIMTGNPGGPGQLWIKQRYIDPAPQGMKIFDRPVNGGRSVRCVFIPSKLRDNRYLASDANYVDGLHAVGSEALVKAWLEGDWSAIEGAFFDKWSNERNVVKPFEIPKHWLRFQSHDWGYAAPFANYWHAVSDGTLDAFPRGAIVTYREWYGCVENEPNTGLRLEDEEIAKGILWRETGEEIAYRVADPSIFGKRAGGPTTAEIMAKAGVHFRRGDNNRLAGHSQMRNRIVGTEDGGPMWYVFSTCNHLIRTLPMMQHDEARPEDMDTNGEDHAIDSVRYGLMSRPWTPATKQRAKPASSSIKRGSLRLDDLMAEAESNEDRVIG